MYLCDGPNAYRDLNRRGPLVSRMADHSAAQGVVFNGPFYSRQNYAEKIFDCESVLEFPWLRIVRKCGYRRPYDTPISTFRHDVLPLQQNDYKSGGTLCCSIDIHPTDFE